MNAYKLHLIHGKFDKKCGNSLKWFLRLLSTRIYEIMNSKECNHLLARRDPINNGNWI